MGIGLQILCAVGGIAAVVVVIALIIRLMMSFVLTRFLCLGFSIASIVMAFPLSKMYENDWLRPDGEALPLLIAASVCTVLAWICFIGPHVFDVEWDGEFDIAVGFFGQLDIEPSETSMFFLNLFISAPVTLVVNFLLAPQFPWMFFLLPIATIVICIVGFMIALKNA